MLFFIFLSLLFDKEGVDLLSYSHGVTSVTFDAPQLYGKTGKISITYRSFHIICSSRYRKAVWPCRSYE